jgi:hypothetical protein
LVHYADIPLRSIARRIRRMCRGVIPIMSAAPTQLICPSIALMMIFGRVIALTFRGHLPRQLFHRTALPCQADIFKWL